MPLSKSMELYVNVNDERVDLYFLSSFFGRERVSSGVAVRSVQALLELHFPP
jgi:hypothetical protein